MWLVIVGIVVFVWRLVDYVYDGAVTCYVIDNICGVAGWLQEKTTRPSKP
jgi:hypothetical protein